MPDIMDGLMWLYSWLRSDREVLSSRQPILPSACDYAEGRVATRYGVTFPHLEKTHGGDDILSPWGLVPQTRANKRNQIPDPSSPHNSTHEEGSG